jgi:collagen triple helix repeat protein
MKRSLAVWLLSLVSVLSFAGELVPVAVLVPASIDSASINYTANTITVSGQGFCADSKLPTVAFNLTKLTLVTVVCSPTSVVANLPVQAQGSYKLTVTNGSGESATLDVTYGAVGPQGPAGPMGMTGATGATGPQGPAGPQGQTGAQGPQGLPGATGATGPQGLTGATGATGPAGPIGLTGAAGPIGPQGPQGVAGPAGANGTNGVDGAQGPQGVQGPQGAAGTNGTNGTNGMGFNFRGAFNTSNTYATNDVVTYAPTSITYNVNLTFGSAGSMVGTITTDGTIGVLSTSNIVSWNLKLADSPTNSTLLTPSNSAFSSGNYNTGGQPNNDFTATSTTLTMAYSNAGFWGVSGTSGAFCMTDWSNCFGPIAFGSWSINGDNAWSYSGVGAGSSQVIGTGGTAVPSATSTYVATAPVTAGAAAPPASPWALMAQAGAAGAMGATGPQGPAGASVQGPQGPIGLTGAQGPAGATGAPGPQGVAGPQGPQGVPGTNGTTTFAGTWTTEGTYSIGQTVYRPLDTGTATGSVGIYTNISGNNTMDPAQTPNPDWQFSGGRSFYFLDGAPPHVVSNTVYDVPGGSASNGGFNCFPVSWTETANEVPGAGQFPPNCQIGFAGNPAGPQVYDSNPYSSLNVFLTTPVRGYPLDFSVYGLGNIGYCEIPIGGTSCVVNFSPETVSWTTNGTLMMIVSVGTTGVPPYTIASATWIIQ